MQQLLDSGLIPDTGQLYWQARLFARYPTIEVRCLDVQPRPDDAVMLTGLVRALVETALAEAAAGAPALDCDQELLQASMWHAARHGLGNTLVGRQRAALARGGLPAVTDLITGRSTMP